MDATLKRAECKIPWVSCRMPTATSVLMALQWEDFHPSVFFCLAFTASSLLRSTLPGDTLHKKAIEMSLHSENIRVCSQTLLRSHSLFWETCLLFVSDKHRDWQHPLKMQKRIISFKAHTVPHFWHCLWLWEEELCPIPLHCYPMQPVGMGRHPEIGCWDQKASWAPRYSASNQCFLFTSTSPIPKLWFIFMHAISAYGVTKCPYFLFPHLPRKLPSDWIKYSDSMKKILPSAC